MVDQQLATDVSGGSRLRRRGTVVGISAVGVAGVIGGLVAGAGMFASAATSGPTFSSDLAVCANPPAPVPGTPLFQSRFTVGGGRVSGTIPAPSAIQLATLGITPTLVNVTVTTQYNSGRSGGNKTDIVTVNTPGHQFHNPLLFDIPPVINSTVVGNGAVKYSAQTTGKAFATVTVSEFVVQATSLTPAVVNGTSCPAGEPQVGSLQTNNVARPAAPTAVTAIAGGSTAADSGANASNDASATVTFTPGPVVAGAPVNEFEVLATDLTHPGQAGGEGGYFVLDGKTAPSTPLTVVETGLAVGDVYTFQVYSVSTAGSPSVSSASSAQVTASTSAMNTPPSPMLAKAKSATK